MSEGDRILIETIQRLENASNDEDGASSSDGDSHAGGGESPDRR